MVYILKIAERYNIICFDITIKENSDSFLSGEAVAVALFRTVLTKLSAKKIIFGWFYD